MSDSPKRNPWDILSQTSEAANAVAEIANRPEYAELLNAPSAVAAASQAISANLDLTKIESLKGFQSAVEAVTSADAASVDSIAIEGAARAARAIEMTMEAVTKPAAAVAMAPAEPPSTASIPSNNRARVEQFIEQAAEQARRPITKAMFHRAVGYRNATGLQAFERNDPNPNKNTHKARMKFEGLLRGGVPAFITILETEKLISPASPPHPPASGS